MKPTILKKVCNVINSCKNEIQLVTARKYINLYYSKYGKNNDWVVESHYKRNLKEMTRGSY